MLIAESGILVDGVAIALTGTSFGEVVAVVIPVTGIAFKGVANAGTVTPFLEVDGVAFALTAIEVELGAILFAVVLAVSTWVCSAKAY